MNPCFPKSVLTLSAASMSLSFLFCFFHPYNRCSKSLPFPQVLNLAMNLLYSWKLNSSAISLKKRGPQRCTLSPYPFPHLPPSSPSYNFTQSFSWFREKFLLLFFNAKDSTCSHPFSFPACSLFFVTGSFLQPATLSSSCFLKDIVHVLTSTDFGTPFFFFPSQLNFSRSVFDPYLDFSFQPIRVSPLLPLFKKKCLLRSLQSPHNCPKQ